MYKFVNSVTETSSKVQELKTYNEVINNPIHGNRWWEVIDEELWNLDSHQTCTYTTLLTKQKEIGSKWMFKMKYYLDSSIKRYKGHLVAQDFAQVYKIDYIEMFTPTIRQELLKIFLVIAAILGIIIL